MTTTSPKPKRSLITVDRQNSESDQDKNANVQSAQESQLSYWAGQMKQMSHKLSQLAQTPQSPSSAAQVPSASAHSLLDSMSHWSNELSADFMWELAIWRDRLVQWSNDVFNLGKYEAESFELTTSANQKSHTSTSYDFLDYGIDFEWFDQMDIDWLQHIFDENHDPEFARVLERIREDRDDVTRRKANRFNTAFIFDEPLQSTYF